MPPEVTTETVPETTPVAVAADPAVAPEVPADPAPDTPPQPEQRRPDPLISTITGLRAKNRDLETRLQRTEREAAEARSLAERLSRGQDAPPQSPIPQASPAVQIDDAEIDRRAEYRLFVRDVSSMREQGIKEFGPGFNESIRALEAYGATDDAFVAQVMAVDRSNAHKLLDTLAKDPERAVSLVSMDPTRRIAELTRMAMASTATAQKTDTPAPPATKPAAPVKAVSRAPAPPPPVEPSSHREVDWRSDDASDDEFDRGFQDMMKRRSARR